MLPTHATGALIQPERMRHQARSPLEQGQRGLLLMVAVLTAAAWLLTLWHGQWWPGAPAGGIDHGGMHDLDGGGLGDAAQLAAAGMAGAEWSLPGLALFVVAWAVMMAAMMFPGLAPMLLTMQAIVRHRQGGEGLSGTLGFFVSGYLLVWTAVGVVLWGVVRATGQMGHWLEAGQGTAWPPLVLGGALILAGLYQLTPFKQQCLDHCRSPFIVVMQRWREGNRGALRMGLGHGLYCLGCCWGLFTVLVAAGVMSLAWMLALTLVDSAEKTLPLGQSVAHAIGVVLLVLGIAVAAGVIPVPGAG